MRSETLGIIFSNMHDESLGEMTHQRTMGSVLFGGRYRLIDFPLSGMTDAGIQNIGIITRRNYQSLMDHVGSGRAWDLARKNGGLTVLPPYAHRSATGLYQGSLEALSGVLSYIRNAGDEKYVAVCDCDMVASLRFDLLQQAHEKSGAGITILCGKQQLEQGDQRQDMVVDIGEDGFLRDVAVGSQSPGEYDTYLHSYIINKDLLIRLVTNAVATDKTSFHKDILREQASRHNVYCYRYDGYFGSINSLESYFRISMDLLKPEVRRELFDPNHPVYTRVQDEVPCRYGLRAAVNNSLLADGCVVDGVVENSILFRGVKVLSGAVVRNSIVMQGTVVGRNAQLDYTVLDKDVTILDGRILAGYATYPLYIAKGIRV